MSLITLLYALILASLLTLSHGILRWVGGQGSDLGFVALLRQQWPTICAALAIYGTVFLLYVGALRTEKLALLYPVYTGLSIVGVLAVGVCVFEENIGLPQYVGGLMIAAGIVFMGLR